MPVTCLIFIALMGLMMTFYGELNLQIRENAAKRDQMYKTREVTVIRLRDCLTDGDREEWQTGGTLEM